MKNISLRELFNSLKLTICGNSCFFKHELSGIIHELSEIKFMVIHVKKRNPSRKFRHRISVMNVRKTPIIYSASTSLTQSGVMRPYLISPYYYLLRLHIIPINQPQNIHTQSGECGMLNVECGMNLLARKLTT